ncbi:MAG: hypothetical protein Ta2B_27880 [Termitinemataceae bacterium]|nr:MAG: hypothetical protein Ta2B_27880 [Termitinemataceae bacterium]
MASETGKTEKIEKPKVELIKRAKDVAAAQKEKVAEVVENQASVVHQADTQKMEAPAPKRVVKVKKKAVAVKAVVETAPAPIAADPIPTLVVPEKSEAVPQQADKVVEKVEPAPVKTYVDTAEKPTPIIPNEATIDSGAEQITAASTESDEKPPEKALQSDVGSVQARISPINTTGPVSYIAPARPAVQAGRVGGKFISPKKNDSEHIKGDAPKKPVGYVSKNAGGQQDSGGYKGGGNWTPRPAGQQGGGQAGGGNWTPRPAGQQGGGQAGGGNWTPRPAGQQGGGYRPGGGNWTPRPAGQQGGGYRPGGGAWTPRPAGQQGGGYRPGGGLRAGDGFGNSANSVPPPLPEGKSAKRAFKAKKSNYQKKEKELEMEEKLLQTKKRITMVTNPIPKSIDIMEIVSVSELARKMNLKASDLIAKLMSMGMMVTINQQIDSETATLLAAEFGADVNIVSLYDETLIETEKDDNESMQPHPPVVTVMGHVDHGKTKLLDAIRSADVVSGEFGGITQHIGAYTVVTPKGGITFLDTPGHEAFTRMRSRGAQVTDIVVLVVAADDGVMPQTIEAMNHAKEAGVPIIVAINKIDKPEANPERVKSQLADLGLQPEEWGGDTMFVHLSALKKEGLDSLIEAILLQAEILDLRADYNRTAEGKVLESRIDHGRGIVATILIEKGTLSVGDSFVAGVWPGKVRAIFNDKGVKIDEATPAMPVEVLGFEGIPNAGDPLQVVEDEKIARGYSVKRQELKRFEDAKNVKKITLENLHDTISDGEIQELKVIIKGDVQGSVEALRASLEKLSTKEIRLNVIQSLPGAINEGDVDLAAASNAILIGFNVRPTPKAKALADQEKVDVRRYNIIYKVVEEMQQAMEGMLKPDTKEQVVANIEVRKVFKISKSGVIAGCYVQNGIVKRNESVNVIRGDTVIFTGKIASLRREKDDVKEVTAGFECGMSIEGFEDIKEGDEFEIFDIVEVARKLSS